MDANAIFGEARKAPENADRVEYAIFPDELGTDQGESGQAVLNKLRARLLDFVRPFVEGYIWQKDAFNLTAVHSLRSSSGWKVEDEGQAGKLRACFAVFVVEEPACALWQYLCVALIQGSD
jgi:hypothetical protein